MDISNVKINKSAVIKLKAVTNDSPVKANAANLSPKKSIDEVHIGDAQTIAEASNKLKQMSEIDMEKVKQVKQAISNGELKINLTSLSKAIMNDHLLGNDNND